MVGEHQTSVLISEEQRAKWEEYIGENPTFNSKADLIRRAVEKEIHSEGKQDSAAEQANAIAEVQSEVRQLRMVIEDLQSDIEALEARTREPSQEAKEITNDIFAVLPPGTDHIWKWERKEIPPDTRHEPDPTAHSGTVTAIANTLDEDELHVEEALQHLQEESHRVQTVEIDGERRWFKEV